jgi:hypothetical protein
VKTVKATLYGAGYLRRDLTSATSVLELPAIIAVALFG